jgi:hypothetical protein
MRTSPMLKGASGSHTPARPDAVDTLIGAVAISKGVVVYLLDRSPESVYLLPTIWNSGCAAWFGRYCLYPCVLAEGSSTVACDLTAIPEYTRTPPTEH